jgi:hypothetical protein
MGGRVKPTGADRPANNIVFDKEKIPMQLGNVNLHAGLPSLSRCELDVALIV